MFKGVNIMISVVMATYNSEKYIKPQLESILKQTQQVDELIIQDDCSTDNTINIIQDFITKNNLDHWSIKKNENNVGYVFTFKEAIKRCKGDIIILCDHDDLWVEDKVKIICQKFNENKDILVLATSFIEIDENDNIIYVKKEKNYSNNNLIRKKIKKNSLNKMNFKDVAVYNISPGCTCAFSSKIKDKIIQKNYQIPHDWQIILTGALMNGLYYYDIVTTKYRIHSNNTIGLGHKRDFKQRADTCKKDLIQKREMEKMLIDLKANKKDIKYINKIIKAFEDRNKLMKTKNIFKYGIKALVDSLGIKGLYQTIGLDILVIIKIYKRSENI